MLFDVLAVVLMLACAYAVLSPRIHTGILGSAGLLCIALAAMVQLDVWASTLAGLRLMSIGVALGLIQVWINRRREAALLRRLQLAPPVGQVREPASCERTEDRAAA